MARGKARATPGAGPPGGRERASPPTRASQEMRTREHHDGSPPAGTRPPPRIAEDGIAPTSPRPSRRLPRRRRIPGRPRRGLIAHQLRAPQLRQAMNRSVCHAVQPDVDSFFQEDGEPDADWKQRRTRTVRDHCTVCPVRAACAELALRDGDTAGVRGGLDPQKLDRRLAPRAAGLSVPARPTNRPANSSAPASPPAPSSCGSPASTSAPGSPRSAGRTSRRCARPPAGADELVAAHRLTAGWTAAA
uniref:4Fe-4S Wbl-type domain-containing protein n=1 Tax=Streptomyces sp. 44414 TaxID=364103 RepID=Q0GC33_9ACTN|nr:unknown [Streptomyces sp. 44414]